RMTASIGVEAPAPRRAGLRLLGPVLSVRSQSDYAEQLRRRLHFIGGAGMIFGPLLALAPLIVRRDVYLQHPHRLFDTVPYPAELLLVSLVDAAIWAYTSAKRARTLVQLRRAEWALVVMVCSALLAIFPHIVVDTLSSYPHLVFVTAQGFSLMWVAGVLMYAIFI